MKTVTRYSFTEVPNMQSSLKQRLYNVICIFNHLFNLLLSNSFINFKNKTADKFETITVYVKFSKIHIALLLSKIIYTEGFLFCLLCMRS